MLNKPVAKNRLEQIDNDYQLVIVGGGIYGAALCWEAAHRGIKTLLVEQNDYACGASSNSLKTIHGGLRALQSLNLSAVLKGIRERTIFLRIAPNYVKPLPCILPTSTSLMKSKPVVGMGLLLYNMLTRINHLFYGHDKNIPFTRLLSRKKFIERAPNINADGITGGALWHDAQVENTERLVWQFIRAAITQDATAINHTAATEYRGQASDGRHTILLRDQISGHEKNVHADAIVDASAAWNFIKQCLPNPSQDENLTFLKSVNIIVRKNIFRTAVGTNIKTDKDHSRLYFFAPWRDCTIIGTWYSSVEAYPDNHFTQEDAETCITEINAAFKQKLLNVDDICNVHIGFLPACRSHDDNTALDKNLFSHYQLKNWSQQTGIQNIYSLRGTKYTLARHDAKQVIDQLIKDLKWPANASRSDRLPLYQTMPPTYDAHHLTTSSINELHKNYGTETARILKYIKNHPASAEQIPGTQHHIMAEIQHAVQHEQALTLSDLLKRRLAIGDRAPPEPETTQYCANVMKTLLGWSNETEQSQITALYASYPDFLTQKSQSPTRT